MTAAFDMASLHAKMDSLMASSNVKMDNLMIATNATLKQLTGCERRTCRCTLNTA